MNFFILLSCGLLLGEFSGWCTSVITLTYFSSINADIMIYQDTDGYTLLTNKIFKKAGVNLKKLHTHQPRNSTIFNQQWIKSTVAANVTENIKIDPKPANSSNMNIISARVRGKNLTIRSCDYDAGAICSLRWNRKEFIDDYDHGRQLQSASSFDHLGEEFNPTEAGGSAVHYGKNPSDGKSKLLSRRATSNVLSTYSQMAFWNPVNGVRTSAHTLNKHVTIGYDGLDNVIEYLTQFNIPSNENHTYGVFEAVTAYMPVEFSSFWTYNHKSRSIAPLKAASADEPHEQNLPIIFSTADKKYAMGIYSPDTPQKNYPTIGYGAFLLSGVPKWNNVFRVSNPKGSLHFRSYVIVGSLDDVKKSMAALHEKF